MSSTLWLVGAGNMGGAMLRGWLGQGMTPARITVIDPFVPSVPDGVALERAIPEGVAPDILVLAVKPQQLAAVRSSFAALAGKPRLLISVLAGVEVETLRAATGAAAVVRAMPNLPASIGRGVTVLHSPDGTDALRAEATALMAPLGQVEWIAQEALFDPVTALSGSGPGFVFRFIDALAEAGAALGLEPEQARRLAIRTVEGAAILAAGSDETPATLADRVASPGGTTREGLNVLDEGQALKRLVHHTLEAASRRSAELAAAARAQG